MEWMSTDGWMRSKSDSYEELRPESDSALPARSLEAMQGAMEQGME